MGKYQGSLFPPALLYLTPSPYSHFLDLRFFLPSLSSFCSLLSPSHHNVNISSIFFYGRRVRLCTNCTHVCKMAPFPSPPLKLWYYMGGEVERVMTLKTPRHAHSAHWRLSRALLEPAILCTLLVNRMCTGDSNYSMYITVLFNILP